MKAVGEVAHARTVADGNNSAALSAQRLDPAVWVTKLFSNFSEPGAISNVPA